MTPIIMPDGAAFRLGDCRQVLTDVASDFVALTLADPPHDERAEPLYRWLAEWSSRVLIDGGSVILFTGHTTIKVATSESSNPPE